MESSLFAANKENHASSDGGSDGARKRQWHIRTPEPTPLLLSAITPNTVSFRPENAKSSSSRAEAPTSTSSSDDHGVDSTTDISPPFPPPKRLRATTPFLRPALTRQTISKPPQRILQMNTAATGVVRKLFCHYGKKVYHLLHLHTRMIS